jgi:hypothetical protein
LWTRIVEAVWASRPVRNRCSVVTDALPDEFG